MESDKKIDSIFDANVLYSKLSSTLIYFSVISRMCNEQFSNIILYYHKFIYV